MSCARICVHAHTYLAPLAAHSVRGAQGFTLHQHKHKSWSICARYKHNRTLVHVDMDAQDAPRTGALQVHIYGDARLHRHATGTARVHGHALRLPSCRRARLMGLRLRVGIAISRAGGPSPLAVPARRPDPLKVQGRIS